MLGNDEEDDGDGGRNNNNNNKKKIKHKRLVKICQNIVCTDFPKEYDL